MFCRNCGKELQESDKVCPNCGAPQGENFQEKAKSVFEKVGKDFGKEVGNIGDDIQGGFHNGPQKKLRTDRSFIVVLLLGLITCGIYEFYFIYSIAKDVNITCAGDGNETPGLLPYIVFSLLTCGIYSLYWLYKIGNRIQNGAARNYNIVIQENGTTLLLWKVLGMLICGLGSYYADYLLIKNINRINEAYNQTGNAQ